MRRTQIYLRPDQDERLARRADAEGTTKSALIRTAIERYLRGDEDTDRRLARFRVALGQAAGIASYLGEGARYVDALRRADTRRLEELEARRHP